MSTSELHCVALNCGQHEMMVGSILLMHVGLAFRSFWLIFSKYNIDACWNSFESPPHGYITIRGIPCKVGNPSSS